MAGEGDSGIRVAGTWLIIFGILFVVGGLIHPRGEGVSSEQTMEIIRTQATAWRASHLLTGLSLIFGAAAALVILVTRTRVASGPLALAGWSLIAIFSSLFSLPFVIESTVVADVAIVGDAEAFDQWYGGFVGGIEGAARPFILIGFFLVAIHQFRSASPLLPRWTSAVAAAGSLLAFGFVLGLLLNIPALLIFVFAFLVPVLWLLALGVQLTRATIFAGLSGPATPT